MLRSGAVHDTSRPHIPSYSDNFKERGRKRDRNARFPSVSRPLCPEFFRLSPPPHQFQTASPRRLRFGEAVFTEAPGWPQEEKIRGTRKFAQLTDMNYYLPISGATFAPLSAAGRPGAIPPRRPFPCGTCPRHPDIRCRHRWNQGPVRPSRPPRASATPPPPAPSGLAGRQNACAPAAHARGTRRGRGPSPPPALWQKSATPT